MHACVCVCVCVCVCGVCVCVCMSMCEWNHTLSSHPHKKHPSYAKTNDFSFSPILSGSGKSIALKSLSVHTWSVRQRQQRFSLAGVLAEYSLVADIKLIIDSPSSKVLLTTG